MTAPNGEFVDPPSLTYSRINRPGHGIVGEGFDLYDVLEVKAWSRRGDITVWARGRMHRKDGHPGPSRALHVDIYQPQPKWLQAIVTDARARLAPVHFGSSEQVNQ